jgi:hypothetical protein
MSGTEYPRRFSAKTLQIIQELRAAGGREPWGFRAALARKYGVNRQRISNIAVEVGLRKRRKRRAAQ